MMQTEAQSSSNSHDADGENTRIGVEIPNRIFVGGISFNTTELQLKHYFQMYGNVKDSKIITDRKGVSKGYGFITFEKQEDALRVQEQATVYFQEKKLNIGPAIRKQPGGQFYRGSRSAGNGAESTDSSPGRSSNSESPQTAPISAGHVVAVNGAGTGFGSNPPNSLTSQPSVIFQTAPVASPMMPAAYTNGTGPVYWPQQIDHSHQGIVVQPTMFYQGPSQYYGQTAPMPVPSSAQQWRSWPPSNGSTVYFAASPPLVHQDRYAPIFYEAAEGPEAAVEILPDNFPPILPPPVNGGRRGNVFVPPRVRRSYKHQMAAKGKVAARGSDERKVAECNGHASPPAAAAAAGAAVVNGEE